jgi:hypothetical protein
MAYISFSFSPRTIGTVRVLAADSLSPSSEEFLIHVLEWRLNHVTDTSGYWQSSMLGELGSGHSPAPGWVTVGYKSYCRVLEMEEGWDVFEIGLCLRKG